MHQRWLQPKYPRLSESPGFWQNLALLFGMLLLCALATLVWQRRQQRQAGRSLLATRESLVERQVREEALRLSQFAIDQSTVGILWVNWDSHVRYANHAAERMLGYAEGALLERPLGDFEPSLNMDRWLELWKGARTGATGIGQFETQCRRADHSLLPVELSLSFLRFRDSEYLVVYLADVTERHRALAALRESEARLKGIAGNVPGLVFRLERDPAEGDLEFPTSVKAARRWWGIRLVKSSTRRWGCVTWCTLRTVPITTGCRTWPWPVTRTGPGRAVSSPARANSVGPTSRPVPGAWVTARWCGTVWCGTSPKASVRKWHWPSPRSSYASCRPTWKACVKKRKPASPGKCMMNWGRC